MLKPTLEFILTMENKLHDIEILCYVLFQMFNKVLKSQTLSLTIKHDIFQPPDNWKFRHNRYDHVTPLVKLLNDSPLINSISSTNGTSIKNPK